MVGIKAGIAAVVFLLRERDLGTTKKTTTWPVGAARWARRVSGRREKKRNGEALAALAGWLAGLVRLARACGMETGWPR